MTVISTLRRMREENQKSKFILYYIKQLKASFEYMRDPISKHMKRMGEREGGTYFKQVKVLF